MAGTGPEEIIFREVPQAHDYYWGVTDGPEPNDVVVPAQVRPRLTLGRLLVLVAMVAINLSTWVATERKARRSSADLFGKLAAIHRQAGDPIEAAWNEELSRRFGAAADRLWTPAPELEWHSPPGWLPPKDSPGP